MHDPKAAAQAVNAGLAAYGERAIPTSDRVPANGFLADVCAAVLAHACGSYAHQPTEWWLDLLESLDFAAAGVSAALGGQRVYVRRERTPEQKAEAIAVHLRAGLAAEDAFTAAGVSRATGYRLIGRPQRRGGAG
jgi:hypothetical protein